MRSWRGGNKIQRENSYSSKHPVLFLNQVERKIKIEDKHNNSNIDLLGLVMFLII